MTLNEFFKKHDKVALAFSGGTDSAYLAYAAVKSGATVRAYFVKSEFQPAFELEDAKRLTALINCPLTVIERSNLTEPSIVVNDKNRCLYCKRAVFGEIKKRAAADGFYCLIDGTNASDDLAERAGAPALSEMQVLSPLRLCDITKDEVRALSREARLFTADKPSYSCLATRVKTGEAITAEALNKIERAETYLFSLGYKNFRVRVSDNRAYLEIDKIQAEKYFEQLAQIRVELQGLFDDVQTADKWR